VLLVEQNARQALALADRAYVLEQGRISLQGSGQALLADPAVIRVYLGVDPTRHGISARLPGGGAPDSQ
jgi:branched-chain amino acid transport system ATP-binding protein